MVHVNFSRELAERSPYLEAIEKDDIEVLFLYEPYDELVLMNMGAFDNKFLKSIENEVKEKEDSDIVDSGGLYNMTINGIIFAILLVLVEEHSTLI